MSCFVLTLPSTNLPAKGTDLYRIDPELKLLVLWPFVSLIYRPITNPANIRILFFAFAMHRLVITLLFVL
jgi:hypothetical protein